MNDVEIQLKLHERYVDNTNMVGEQTETGARYEGGRIQITEKSRNEEEGMPDDKTTMKLLKSTASTIHQSTRMTIDYQSKYADGCWMWIGEVEGRSGAFYEHYEKERATRWLFTRSQSSHQASNEPY